LSTWLFLSLEQVSAAPLAAPATAAQVFTAPPPPLTT